MKLLYNIILLIIAAVVLAFAVANRALVPLSFNPLEAGSPDSTIQVPLFAIIFASVIVGVLAGGMAVWFRQGRHRRAARIARGEAARQRAEADRLRSQAGTANGATRDSLALPSSTPF